MASVCYPLVTPVVCIAICQNSACDGQNFVGVEAKGLVQALYQEVAGDTRLRLDHAEAFWG